ncbi:MAG: hypothetical protein WBP91_11130 [Terriglobales bacterium]
MPIPRFSRATTRAVFAGILFLGLLAMTARTATDPDLWWHLRTGQWIVETGHIPHSDPFSFTRAGHHWVSHEWLSEVAFYGLWKQGGPAALMVFAAMVTTLGFMLLYFRVLAGGGKRRWAAAATALGALAAAPSWGTRPQMFTFTLASLLLWLIERGEERPRLLFWIPPLFLLWLNLHGGFALGPALLLAYGLGLIMETATGNTPWQEARPIVWRVLLLLLVCLALVPLNPSGAHLYLYPFHTLFSSGMRSLIGEWRSPDFHEGLYRPLLLVWLLLLTALASFRSRPRGRVLVPLLVTAFAALDAARHVPIFVLLAMPVIAAALPAAADNRARVAKSARRRAPISLRSRLLFNSAVLVLMAVFAAVRWSSLAHSQDAREAQQFPQKAVAFLRSANYPRNIFVFYDWGGYAIWKLYPEYRVFVDGRADLYGDDLLRQSIRTVMELRTGWREVLDHWNVDALLVPPSCAVAQALLLDPKWHQAFRDSKAIILLRAPSAPENKGISTNPSSKGQESEKNVSQSRPESAKLWRILENSYPVDSGWNLGAYSSKESKNERFLQALVAQ